MAAQQRTLEEVPEQMPGADTVSAERMFGEYGLDLEGKLFAAICDDRLFVRPTGAGRASMPEPAEGIRYPGAAPCSDVTGDCQDDTDRLTVLARPTAAALPAPCPHEPKAESVKWTA